MLVMVRIITLLSLGIISLSGCAAPAVTSEPTRGFAVVAARDAFIDDVLTVLRERDFRPADVRRADGWIMTEPSTSKQWFEFWRADALGGYQALEASLHTIRRRVQVELAQDERRADNTLAITVTVEKERYTAPSRQVTTASGALAIYSEKLPTREGLRRALAPAGGWVPLGRDPLLEEHLLDIILSKAEAIAASEPRAPTTTQEAS